MKGWCQGEALSESWQVFTKVTIEDSGELEFQKVTIHPTEGLTSYQMPQADQPKIEKFEDALKVLSLHNYEDQKLFFERFISPSSTLSHPLTFSPTSALQVNDEIYYPCENYSSSLDVIHKQREYVEFQVLVPRLVPNSSHKLLESRMELKLPIIEVDSSYTEIVGTQWCQWFEGAGSHNPHLCRISRSIRTKSTSSSSGSGIQIHLLREGAFEWTFRDSKLRGWISAGKTEF
jgi:hypothetical protein